MCRFTRHGSESELADTVTRNLPLPDNVSRRHHKHTLYSTAFSSVLCVILVNIGIAITLVSTYTSLFTVTKLLHTHQPDITHTTKSKPCTIVAHTYIDLS